MCSASWVSSFVLQVFRDFRTRVWEGDVTERCIADIVNCNRLSANNILEIVEYPEVCSAGRRKTNEETKESSLLPSSLPTTFLIIRERKALSSRPALIEHTLSGYRFLSFLRRCTIAHSNFCLPWYHRLRAIPADGLKDHGVFLLTHSDVFQLCIF